MSQEDVEIVRRSFDAWNRWDLEALRRVYAEDARVEAGITRFGRTFMGEELIARWAAEMRETWAEVRWELDRIIDADDVVVSFYRGIGIGRESGVEVVRDLTGIYRLHDGLIVFERVYLNREEALEAAGLSE